MNDYLGNLVARTLGQMPIVEPRLVSRFEQLELHQAFRNAPDIFQQRAAEPVEVEEELSADAATLDRAVRLVRSPRRVMPADQAGETGGSVGTATADDHRLFQSAPVSTAVSVRTSQMQPGADGGSQASAQTEQIAAPPFAPQQPPPVQIQPERAGDAAKTFADLPPSRQAALIQPENRRAGSEPQTAGEKQHSRGREKLDGRPSQSFSRVEPRQPAAWLPPVAPAPPVPAIERKPVIKVTIGRVEVRAVLNAPAAPVIAAAEQAPRLQSLPLSEYLRRRNNGEL